MSNVVKKKKRWGKIYQYTPTVRDTTLDEEKSKEIEDDLKKPNSIFTPVSLGQKHNIKVSLAKKILAMYEEDGKLTKEFDSAGHKMYRN